MTQPIVILIKNFFLVQQLHQVLFILLRQIINQNIDLEWMINEKPKIEDWHYQKHPWQYEYHRTVRFKVPLPINTIEEWVALLSTLNHKLHLEAQSLRKLVKAD